MFVFSVNNEINGAMSFVAYATTHVFICKETSTIHANLDTSTRRPASRAQGGDVFRFMAHHHHPRKQVQVEAQYQEALERAYEAEKRAREAEAKAAGLQEKVEELQKRAREADAFYIYDAQQVENMHQEAEN